MLASTLWLPDLRRKDLFDPDNPTLMEDLGLVHKAAAGRFSLLPLGTMVLERMKDVYRTHMQRSGAVETVFLTMAPAEFWRSSGRWDSFGPALVKATLNGGGDICFNPTHEEAAVAILKGHLKSYRELPMNLFCIQKVYRDEPRPKSELLRTLEFYMADSYSFHVDVADAERGYLEMQAIFANVFEEFRLPYRVVHADNGLIGGPKSVEFQYAHALGESNFVACGCGYASDADLRSAGSPCPDCGGQMKSSRGIEMAHVFVLEDTYTTRMGLRFRNRQNVLVAPQMGCTGIGMTRVLQTLVLEHIHGDGIAWPAPIAPFDAVLVPQDAPGQEIQDLRDRLEALAVRCLLDDRPLPKGAKRALTDFLNPPFVVSERAARDGWQLSAPGQVGETLAPDDLIARVCVTLTEARAARMVKTVQT